MTASPNKRISKDAVSLAISLLAFSLSALTAYYTLFRVTYVASIVVGENYGISTKFDGPGLTSYSSDDDLVFINKGNRPIAILRLYVQLYQLSKIDPRRQDCSFGKTVGQAQALPAEGFAPFVVPADDVRIIRPTFSANPSAERAIAAEAGENPRYMLPALPNEKTPTFASCLHVDFVAAGDKVEGIERHLFDTVDGASSPGPFQGGNPIRLIKRTELPW